MGIQKLTQSAALSEGSDLWFVPHSPDSYWHKSLNWYTNFLLAQADLYVSPHLSDTLKRILEDCEIPDHTPNLKNEKPFLISSQKYLPNKWLVLLSESDQLEKWVQNIHRIQNQMKIKTLRVFLPQQKKQDDFIQLWSTLQNEDCEMTLIQDPHLS